MMEFDRFSVRIPSGNLMQAGPVSAFVPPEVEPEERIVSTELLTEVKSMEPGSFKLIKGVFADVATHDGVVAEFLEVPELGITRMESAHEVMLGQLIMSTAAGEIPELVAVKPLESAKVAAHEFALAQYFSGPNRPVGFNTFAPLGLTRLESSGEYGVITKYEHGTISLDNIFWNPENDPKSILVTQAIGKCAFILGSLHAAGWTHGDAQIKNMFRSNKDEVFVADLESTQPLRQVKGRIGELDILAVEESINRDFLKLFSSLDARAEGREEHDYSEQLNTMFSLIYNGIINNPQSAIPRDIRKTPDAIMELYYGNSSSGAA